MANADDIRDAITNLAQVVERTSAVQVAAIEKAAAAPPSPAGGGMQAQAKPKTKWYDGTTVGGFVDAGKDVANFGKNAYRAAAGAESLALRAGASAGVGAAAGAGAGFTAGLTLVALASVKYAEVMVDAADKAKIATQKQFESMSRLADSSASLAQVFGERERDRILRDRESGNMVAGTARGLAESEDRLGRGTLSIDALRTNVENFVQRVVNDAINTLIKPVEDIAGTINTYLFGGDQEKPYDLGEWAADTVDEVRRKDERLRQIGRELREGAKDW